MKRIEKLKKRKESVVEYFQKLPRKLLYKRPVRKFLHLIRQITLPGFQGVPIFDVLDFFIRNLLKESIANRAKAMAFSFFLALFPMLLFLFSLLPYFPIQGIQNELYVSLYDILPEDIYAKVVATMDEILTAVDNNFEGNEKLRQFIINRTPFFGNDDDYADTIAVKVYDDLVEAIEGHPNTRGGTTQLNMLSTTCHNYFGSVCGASCNGRLAKFAISDGTSPAHDADRQGPTSVVKSLGKLDQTKSGGTLLNVRFVPQLFKRDEDLKKIVSLIRTYFNLGGHHIQFNVVDTATLLEAQTHPDEYKDLLVRVAGYSDYFNDMTTQLQNEIIARTENEEF